MPCLFAVFEICHRSHSPLCSLFQIPKPTKIQVKIAQLILSPLLIKKFYGAGNPCGIRLDLQKILPYGRHSSGKCPGVMKCGSSRWAYQT